MARGLIIAIGLDNFMAEFSLNEIKPDHVVFLATEVTLPLVHELVQKRKITSHKICYIKDIFSTGETIQEFLSAFQWMKERADVKELFIDATNCITVIEMATYVSASFIELYKGELAENIEFKLVYVHAQYALSESGVHVEVRGTERLIELEKPTDSLSFVMLFGAVRAFNERRYTQARGDFQSLVYNATGEKSILYQGLTSLAAGYEYWDKMNFAEAAKNLAEAKTWLERAGRLLSAQTLVAKIQANLIAIGQLLESRPAALIIDLYENAMRREQDGRYDDALARLYACAEHIIQHHLLTRFSIDTKAPDYTKLASDVKDAFARQLKGHLPEELELKRAALLLSLLGDPVGKQIQSIGYKSFTGLLGIRNASILAHGMKPIEKDHFHNFKSKLIEPLWSAFLECAGVDGEKLVAHTHLTIGSEMNAILYRKGVDAKEIVSQVKSAVVH